jgi:hypothetical protein
LRIMDRVEVHLGAAAEANKAAGHAATK